MAGRNAVLLALSASACAGPRGETVREEQAPIELSEAESVFALATSLTEQRSRRARFREEAARATGALLVGLVEKDGTPSLADDGTPLRASCGVTFVAPSFALTAAHCVDGSNRDVRQMIVEMYRPTRALQTSAASGTMLRGTFPDFEASRFSERDGYFVDRFGCRLVGRCAGPEYGGPIDCDHERAPTGDTALLECAGSPGARYGYLNLALADEPGAEVFMPWKHEVYAGHETSEEAFFEHYVRYDDLRDNFHYFGRSAGGEDRNQLLPLVSTDFPDGTPHRKASAGVTVGTDLWGCRGSSGSGVLQPTPDEVLELLGPAVGGTPEHRSFLCNHVPSLDGTAREPGGFGLSYDRHELSRHLLERAGEALASDCDPLKNPGFSVFSEFSCVRAALSRDASDHVAWPLQVSSARGVFERSGRDVLALGSGDSFDLAAFALTPNTDYRLEVSGWAQGVCVDDDCPELGVAVDGLDIARLRFDAPSGAALPLAGTFTTDETGEVRMTLNTSGGERFEVGALTVHENGRTNHFDLAEERLEAALLGKEPGVSPMRFVGDGSGGFSALLFGGETLVLGRQALAPSRRWVVNFRRSEAAPLQCALLDAAGAAVLEADCSHGSVVFDDRSGTAARAALSIRSTEGDAAVAIDDVSILSSRAPDSDLDGITNPADRCPDGAFPEGSRIELAERAVEQACTSAPVRVALSVPALVGTCGVLEIRGYLHRVRGEPFERRIDLDRPEIELPLGEHRIRWLVTDDGGKLLRTLDQGVEVVLEPSAKCCGAGLLFVDGGAGFPAFSNAVAPFCASLGAGDDFVALAAGGFVAGGSGNDYLAGAESAVLVGGPGADYLGAIGGDVALYGGPGPDTLHAFGADTARLVGGGGADTLVGSRGVDHIFPGAGAVLVAGGSGDDTITFYDACELGSALHLSGGPGHDTVISPVPRGELESALGSFESIEQVTVDTARRYLSECFKGDLTE